MRLDGQPYAPRNPRDAARHGIAFIHQELNLFPNLTIAENLFLTGFPRRRGLPLIDRRALRERGARLLEQVGLDVAARHAWSSGSRRANGSWSRSPRRSSLDARLIILDEPTTSLSARETRDALRADRPPARARPLA